LGCFSFFLIFFIADFLRYRYELYRNEVHVRDFFHRLLGGRYLAMLESEVARLRAENRALTNSLLGTAGFPPVEYPEPLKPLTLPRLRKRSWHQIQAWREAGAVRDAAIDIDGREEARTNGPVSQS
jgi:hypothetical protein